MILKFLWQGMCNVQLCYNIVSIFSQSGSATYGKFKGQKNKVTWHIESDFTQEMSSMSTAVS